MWWAYGAGSNHHFFSAIFPSASKAAPALAGALGQPDVGVTIQLTAVTSLLAVVIIVLLGTPMALLLARRRVTTWRIIDALVDIPVALVLTSFGVLVAVRLLAREP